MYPPLTGFMMLFDHQNLGIDTSYVQISLVMDMDIGYEIFFLVMAEHVAPVYHFRRVKFNGKLFLIIHLTD